MSTNPAENNRRVAQWLLICCALVFAMVLLGGVTRLTGSGLSMVEWQPVTGILPPMSDEAWRKTFEMYQQSPEFQKVNSHMNVDDFKGIFWLEYLHRLLGRTIGIVFLLPFLYFVGKGYIRKNDWLKYALMFVLGGMQGVLGWYMVKSGLVDNPRVSQYRLTSHLIAAFLIYAYMFWVALSLLFPAVGNRRHSWYGKSMALATLISITVISGGFVAGLKAGKVFNTFPMMGDYWVPPGLMALEPWWRNLFDNIATVQFDHRVLALATFGLIVVFWAKFPKADVPARIRKGVNALLHTSILQVALGITTLLLIVPIPLAVAHQGVAMLLFTIALFLCHGLRRV
ncbi:MAG: COX15/CtaA family protein [Proteobacteria bacterium]|nr:COX15/CtaA family protein [Pseudomonadota bacterium]MDA0993269.1 COX15/CtaA family protein [Pseudomonadota bacterium]